MKKFIAIILLCILLAGCRTPKVLAPDIANNDSSSVFINESEVDSFIDESSSQNETSSNEDSSITETPSITYTPPTSVDVWCAAPSISEDALHPIVLEARKHLGNYNGNMFWQWYGFNSYTAWCACFVSYCAAQTNVDVPKFAWVPNGEQYFKSIGKWESKDNYTPKSGDIIFFVYDGYKEACHVGIVECVVGNRVYTIEGNYNNSCQRANYPLYWKTIMGYGVI